MKVQFWAAVLLYPWHTMTWGSRWSASRCWGTLDELFHQQHIAGPVGEKGYSRTFSPSWKLGPSCDFAKSCMWLTGRWRNPSTQCWTNQHGNNNSCWKLFMNAKSFITKLNLWDGKAYYSTCTLLSLSPSKVKLEVSHHIQQDENWTSSKPLVFVMDETPEVPKKTKKRSKNGSTMTSKNFGAFMNISKIKTCATTLLVAWRCRLLDCTFNTFNTFLQLVCCSSCLFDRGWMPTHPAAWRSLHQFDRFYALLPWSIYLRAVFVSCRDSCLKTDGFQRGQDFENKPQLVWTWTNFWACCCLHWKQPNLIGMHGVKLLIQSTGMGRTSLEECESGYLHVELAVLLNVLDLFFVLDTFGCALG